MKCLFCIFLILFGQALFAQDKNKFNLFSIYGICKNNSDLICDGLNNTSNLTKKFITNNVPVSIYTPMLYMSKIIVDKGFVLKNNFSIHDSIKVNNKEISYTYVIEWD